MDSSKQFMVVGTIVVIITAVGPVSSVTSQTADLGQAARAKTIAMPRLPQELTPKPVDEKDKEWKARLTDEQYQVTRKKATERGVHREILESQGKWRLHVRLLQDAAI